MVPDNPPPAPPGVGRPCEFAARVLARAARSASMPLFGRGRAGRFRAAEARAGVLPAGPRVYQVVRARGCSGGGGQVGRLRFGAYRGGGEAVFQA